MADVTGPISTLPNSRHRLPEGATCDDCFAEGKHLVPAVTRVQGETDSFGSEMYDLCERHVKVWREAQKAARNGTCDWCHKDVDSLSPTRDIDEGSYGPVYQVCNPCRDKQFEAICDELAEYNERQQIEDDYEFTRLTDEEFAALDDIQYD